MLDQSHNVSDPIESLMLSAIELQRAYAQALLIDRAALAAAQDANDALGAHMLVKQAYTTDVTPLLAHARRAPAGPSIRSRSTALRPIARTRRPSGRRAESPQRGSFKSASR